VLLDEREEGGGRDGIDWPVEVARDLGVLVDRGHRGFVLRLPASQQQTRGLQFVDPRHRQSMTVWR
jgi:hypothetical protein